MNLLQFAALCALPILASCSSNKPVQETKPMAVPAPVVEPLAGDRDIEQHLETLILSTKRHLGRKEVQLLLRNRSERELRLRYALEWKNRRGEIIGGYHHDWAPLTLAPLESKTLTIQGPTPAADTWRFHAEGLEPNSEEPNEAPSN